MASSGKKTGGRRKIEIKIIENEDDGLISFSKRYIGIYKKISKLSTLCGGENLYIIFSLAGPQLTRYIKRNTKGNLGQASSFLPFGKPQ
ncbi:hypothetical protein Gotur_036080 [Gossypium turneri]